MDYNDAGDKNCGPLEITSLNDDRSHRQTKAYLLIPNFGKFLDEY